jgi:hypothetical protein
MPKEEEVRQSNNATSPVIARQLRILEWPEMADLSRSQMCAVREFLVYA